MKLKTILIATFLSIVSSCQIVYGQGNPMYSPSFVTLKTNNGVKIAGKAFTGSTVDTTQAIPLYKYGGMGLFTQLKDTAKVVITYQLSYDSLTWTPPIPLDSLKRVTDTTNVKNLSFTTHMLAAPYGRFIFTMTSVGTVTPTYSAGIKIQSTP